MGFKLPKGHEKWFKYTHSSKTDIRETFKRERKRLEDEARQKVVQIKQKQRLD